MLKLECNNSEFHTRREKRHIFYSCNFFHSRELVVVCFNNNQQKDRALDSTTTIATMSSIECTFTSEYTWCVPTYVVILPKITGMISVISSAILAKLMISSPNKKPYHRLLLNISFADILSSSIVHVAGSWLMPQGTAPLSRGNLATCDAQGFLVQIIIVVIPYLNASLSTY